MADMRSHKPSDQKLSCFGFWFADDGQYFCKPSDVDLFLRCLDKAATSAGLSRGHGEDIKSIVRLIGSAEAIANFQATQEENWVHSCA